MKKRVVLGLTGGIASGKSTVLKIMRRSGVKTLDCDKIARDVVRPGRPALRKIKAAFGNSVFTGHRLDRKEMARVIFNNAKARKKLEGILHPEIIKRVKAWIRRHPKGVLVVDIPLLFESKLQKLADLTVLVWVPPKLQLERLMSRNGYSREAALRRIRSQMPIGKKRKLADCVIDNSKSASLTASQTRALLRRLTERL